MMLLTLLSFAGILHAQTVALPADLPPPPPPEEDLKIEATQKSITQDERRQREALSHLFVLNKNLRDISKKQEALNQKTFFTESQVKMLAQDVATLEGKRESQKEMLNKRLRQLYQGRGENGFHWIFSSNTPIELERNHRFLKRMIDSDHRQLKTYLDDLALLKSKRAELKSSVARLITLRKEAVAQEKALSREQSEKAAFVEKLKSSKAVKLSELKDLHARSSKDSYAFFERKGELQPPVEGAITRAYGTYVDPKYRFRLEQKGSFYSLRKRENVHAIYRGKVAYAAALPGYGKTVIIDHGDNYYSVYAFAAELRVTKGSEVQPGEILAVSGESSPLFGPGLYFEIRHFTDAIDPRPWIKDSGIQTASED